MQYTKSRYQVPPLPKIKVQEACSIIHLRLLVCTLLSSTVVAYLVKHSYPRPVAYAVSTNTQPIHYV